MEGIVVSEELFRLTRIKKSFGEKKVLKGVDLTVNRGDIVGFLGLNGEGKSTLTKILLGLITQDEGEVIRNFNVKKDAGVMLQEISVPERMKVIEWIDMIRRFSNSSKTSEEILEAVNLSNERHKYCNTLSGGQQRRAQFATAIASNPKILILDEPTVGMDIVSKRAFWDTLINFSFESDLTIILISHDLEEVSEFCNRIVVLDKGFIKLDHKMVDINKQLQNNSLYSLEKSSITEKQLEAMNHLIFKYENDELLFTDSDIDTVVFDNHISVRLLNKKQKTLRELFMEVLENE